MTISGSRMRPDVGFEAASSWSELYSIMGEEPQKILLVNSFITADRRQFVGPRLDFHAHQAPVVACGDNDHPMIVSFRQLPGYRDYLEEQGVMRKSNLYEIPQPDELFSVLETPKGARAWDSAANTLLREWSLALDRRATDGPVLSLKEPLRVLSSARAKKRPTLCGGGSWGKTGAPPSLNDFIAEPNGSVELSLLLAFMLNEDVRRRCMGKIIYPTFTNERTVLLQRLFGGSSSLDPEASFVANNKSYLKENAERFGFLVPPGFQHFSRQYLGAYENVKVFIQSLDEFRRKHKGRTVWVKASPALGGDLVRPISGSAGADIAAEIVLSFVKTFQGAHQGSQGSSFVPDFLAELDVHEISRTRKSANINIQAVVGKRIVVPFGWSSQITSHEGAFLGNLIAPATQDIATLLSAARDAVMRVGEWVQSIGYRGIIGVDLILVEGERGPIPYVIDCNARLNTSTPQLLLRQRLEAQHWWNIWATFPRPIRDFEDIRAVLGECLYSSGMSEGIIPMVFKSIVDLYESPEVQLGIFAKTQDGVEKMQRALRSCGVVIDAAARRRARCTWT